jgi:hypothetical protein
VNRSSFLSLAAIAPISLATAACGGPPSDTLLGWAQKLVAEVAPANNFYGSHPTFVDWANSATGGVARNRSVCSSFASHLLEQTFGYTASDIDAWFGKTVPQAVDYHATIAAGNGFLRIVHITKILPGDIIAIAYPAGSKPTGHVVIAASQAVGRTATVPIEPGTAQYDLEVIDSAQSGHGPTDTRNRADGTWTTGVGHGVMRLYARADDTLAGHAWSDTAHSVFRPVSERTVAIGRLDVSRAPHPSSSPGQSTDSPDSGPSDDDAATDD